MRTIDARQPVLFARREPASSLDRVRGQGGEADWRANRKPRQLAPMRVENAGARLRPSDRARLPSNGTACATTPVARAGS